MSKTVTWLHFSDMHLCQPKTGWEASRILETLRVDLDKMRDRGLLPDLIFFTGDAAFGQLRVRRLVHWKPIHRGYHLL